MFKPINEDRLLKLIHNFFEHPQSLVTELVQNAVRAKAKNITINTDNGRLIVTDDGIGCDSITPLLTLAESDWDEAIEQNQQPAGWGLFVLYCQAKEVEITSRFGTFKFDAELFLKDANYRDSISDGFIDRNQTDGFQISATMKNAELEQKITSISDSMLQFFPINVRINGRDIKQVAAAEIGKDYLIKTTYMGNEVFIGTINHYFPHLNKSAAGISSATISPAVIWYGIPILTYTDGARAPVIINVTQGSPLTPVLPFRTSIKQDERLSQFQEFVRQEIADYCIEQINNNKKETPCQDVSTLLSLMRTMEDLATQEELDKLNQFYITEKQPYHNHDCSVPRIVAKGESVISEDIEISVVEKGKKRTLKPRVYHRPAREFTGDYEMIFLPDNTIVQCKTKSRCPEWLNIQTRIRKVDIHITKDATKYQGNLCWCKAEILSADQGLAPDAATAGKLDVIGIDSGYGLCTTTIYYSNNAESVWGLQHPIVNHLFNDEGDTFDSQEYHITNHIGDDLQNITGKHARYDLLEGLQKVSGINIENIRNIEINKKKATITLKGGKKKVLLLA